MKGQYMAVESVTTIGLGVIMALGVITAFSGYKSSITDQAREYQAETVESKVLSSIHSLKYVESGRKNIDLPDTIGSTPYEVALTDQVLVATESYSYRGSIDLEDKDFRGSVSGGEAVVIKNGNQYTLRSN